MVIEAVQGADIEKDYDSLTEDIITNLEAVKSDASVDKGRSRSSSIDMFTYSKFLSGTLPVNPMRVGIYLRAMMYVRLAGKQMRGSSRCLDGAVGSEAAACTKESACMRYK